MELERTDILEKYFIQSVQDKHFPTSTVSLNSNDVGIDNQTLLNLFESQLISRHLDLLARELKRKNTIYYTIGSSGHECMAAVALAFHVTDMAFLHYRDAAFVIQRAQMAKQKNIIQDLLLSFMAAKDDPIASGRHKVLGSVSLNIPPQTSTIASHLPKAVGVAASIKRAQILKIASPLATDSVVICSFGDATVNHSTALGAFNVAQWIVQKHYPLPIVFICEDNGWGISVPTPTDWVEGIMSSQPWLTYVKADGLNVLDTYRATQEAVHVARIEKSPVFLHLKMVRLLGHAGADYELHYRTQQEIERDEANDPLLHTAKLIIEAGYLSAEEVLKKYDEIKQEVADKAVQLRNSNHLSSAEAVMISIIPPRRKIKVPPLPSDSERKKILGKKYEKLTNLLNLNQQINFAITDLMLQYKNIIVFGEDVAQKGGVYRVTADLLQQFGPARVFDTLLDEQTILGQAIGHAHNGFLPIPEIQFLAYLHNAEDQLRGEAATLSFFSNGQFTNPMVLRIASFAYQKGFGGHFHNDNSIAVLRDIPGIIIACPSNGRDAALMLRRCVQLAYVEQRIVVFLEPIALYMEKDLHEKGDNAWLFEYPKLSEMMEFGALGVYGESDLVTIITYGNGHYLSQQAARELQEQYKVPVKIIDLRWLAPLNEKDILQAVDGCKNICIVDEERKTGSISEQLIALLVEGLPNLPKIKRITGNDTFIPLGEMWRYVLPSKNEVIQAILSMVTR